MIYKTRYSGIEIERCLDTQFPYNVECDLRFIEKCKVGKELLTLIDNRCAGIGVKLEDVDNGPLKITICKQSEAIHAPGKVRRKRRGAVFALPGQGIENAIVMPAHERRIQATSNSKSHDNGHGYGNKVIITYVPEHCYDWPTLRNPSWLVLAHELIHAWHSLSGAKKTGTTDGVDNEELFTVGIGPYRNTRISENQFRKEYGLANRNQYARY